jgi:exonuclease VII large subunit
MQAKHRLYLAPMIPALITMGFIAGCESRGESERSSMSVSIEDVRTDVDAVQNQSDQAVAALVRLQHAQAGTDLKPLFKDYSDAVANADSQEKKLKQRSSDMAKRKDEYIQSWDKQLTADQDPDLKSQGEQRVDKVKETFDEALSGINTAQSQVDPLIDHLKQIQSSLSYDLTDAGVSSISKSVANAKSAVADADQALGKARRQLHEASATIGSNDQH